TLSLHDALPILALNRFEVSSTGASDILSRISNPVCRSTPKVCSRSIGTGSTLPLCVHKEEQFIFNYWPTQSKSIRTFRAVLRSKWFVIFYLASGKVVTGKKTIDRTFELVRTTACHGIDTRTCKTGLRYVKWSYIDL